MSEAAQKTLDRDINEICTEHARLRKERDDCDLGWGNIRVGMNDKHNAAWYKKEELMAKGVHV